MKKLAMTCLVLFAGITSAAAQQEFNFYGSWEWAEANRARKEKGNESQLTTYPATQSGNTIRIKYCYNTQCDQFTARKSGRNTFSFRRGKGYFEFKVNNPQTELQGTYWQYGDRNDPPSAHITMRLAG